VLPLTLAGGCRSARDNYVRGNWQRRSFRSSLGDVVGGKHGWTVMVLGTHCAAAIEDSARGDVLPPIWRTGGAAINTRGGVAEERGRTMSEGIGSGRVFGPVLVPWMVESTVGR
jgi:hypothetical protein